MVMLTTGPQNSGRPRTPTVMWLWFWSQTTRFTKDSRSIPWSCWLPFATFPAGFPPAKSIGELEGKVASHLGKLPNPVVATPSPIVLAPCWPLPHSAALIMHALNQLLAHPPTLAAATITWNSWYNIGIWVVLLPTLCRSQVTYDWLPLEISVGLDLLVADTSGIWIAFSKPLGTFLTIQQLNPLKAWFALGITRWPRTLIKLCSSGPFANSGRLIHLPKVCGEKAMEATSRKPVK